MHSIPSRRSSVRTGPPILAGIFALALTVSHRAGAQQPAAPAPAAPAAPPAAAPPAAGPQDDLSILKQQLDAQRVEIEALKLKTQDIDAQKAQLEELKALQDAANEAAASQAPEPLKIYGFTDFGWQTTRAKEGTLLANFYDNVNSSGYVIGNLNFYFDAQPIENWRSLVEIRFTNAPQGEIDNFGGIAGNFQRRNVEQSDPHATAINAPMWPGTTVIERAFVEWTRYQYLNVRVGNWFTPFGIWNEDHGTPTLIAMALPQFLLQKFVPLRQTGLMLKGSVFLGEWQLGYQGYVSNGRQELTNYNLTDRMAFGARTFLKRDTGDLNATFGASFYAGRVQDKQVDVIGVNPVRFDSHSSFEYDEWAAGVDVSLDIGRTRVRSEGLVRRVKYRPGKRPAANPLFGPGSYEADRYQQSAYLLVAHQLPWAGLEPYLYGEVFQQPTALGDGIANLSLGLNVRFNQSVTWKNQASRAFFFNWLEHAPGNPADNNVTSFYTRIVVAF